MSPAEELRYLILGAQREGARAYAAALAPTGLTPAQAEAVVVLAEAPGISLVGLGARLVCEAGSPSRLVDALVRQGLVHRDPDPRSRRSVVLRLTTEGSRRVARVRAAEAAVHEAITDSLDDDAMQGAITALRRLLDRRPTLDALTLRREDRASARR
ncbi:MarR family winged helix-turn-helix transcriptional regulator [Clavibacter michiganensis]|uniref:MarR family winged helix-turn-helix transcriptional regulator n=1 Tax=Clavibacter michiganensis TaxID=28447 RepID=UPI003EBEBF73